MANTQYLLIFNYKAFILAKNDRPGKKDFFEFFQQPKFYYGVDLFSA